MEWYEALLLGIIQGLTEFLPVSSSGHLEISSYLLNTDTSQNLFFNMMVHVATAFSILYVFREDIFKFNPIAQIPRGEATPIKRFCYSKDFESQW